MALNAFFCNSTITWSWTVPFLAFVVSIIAVLYNRYFSKKNIQLSIQQAVFKIVSEKAMDCNRVWTNEPLYEQNETSPHFLVITELIISKEVIEKSFALFRKNSSSIIEYKDDYYYLLWKQLHPNLRGWVKKTSEIAKKINDETYTQQIRDLWNIFEKHFE